MGLRAYLELHRKDSLPNALSPLGRQVLFEKKSSLPFAWFLFFGADDFRRKDKSGSGRLVVDATEGVTRARARLEFLRADASTSLMRLLTRFIEVVAGAGSGQLVLNSGDLDSAKGELTPPLTWLSGLDGERLSRRQLKRAEQLFDEGIAWGSSDEPDADPTTMDLDDAVETVGDPSAPEHEDVLTAGEDREPLETRQAPRAESAEAIASVLAAPDDLSARLVCADLLTGLGDLRGEFILLQCRASSLTVKQEKRLEKLHRSLGPALGAPFEPAEVTFENGFAAVVRFNRPPAVVPKADDAWKTVHTLWLSAAPAMLTEPAFRDVRRVLLNADDVVWLAQAGRPVPFRSICFGADHTVATWQALTSLTVFPQLVEARVDDSTSVWLPEGAQELISHRPGIRVRTHTPIELEPSQLRLLSPEEDAERRAKWSAPGRGAQLAGARFDNAY